MNVELRYGELKWSDIHGCNGIRTEIFVPGFLRVFVPSCLRGDIQSLLDRRYAVRNSAHQAIARRHLQLTGVRHIPAWSRNASSSCQRLRQAVSSSSMAA